MIIHPLYIREKKMKIGILGAGTIVPDFLEAQKQIKEIEVGGIFGTENDRARMEQLAADHSIEKIYFDYDEMLNSDIDTIYIALPNHLHFSFAEKAIGHKKNVIVEKPFVLSGKEGERLAALAEENHVFLFEAMPIIYFDSFEKLKEEAEKLGRIISIQINYAQRSRRYDDFVKGIIHPVFDVKKGGGALMDLNVYNIHLALMLLGAPDKVNYHTVIEKGVDTSGTVVLEYPGGTAVLSAAKNANAPCSIVIEGEKGYICSSDPTNFINSFKVVLNDEEPYMFSEKGCRPRLYPELKRFTECILNDDREYMKKQLSHTFNVMSVLDDAKKEAGII